MRLSIVMGAALAVVSSVPAARAADMIYCEGDYRFHLQGVATDGTNVFWSFTTDLVKTDRSGRVLCKDAIRREEGHMGDLCFKDDSGWTNLGVQTICRHRDQMLFGCYGADKPSEGAHEHCTFVIDSKALTASASLEFPSIIPIRNRFASYTASSSLFLRFRSSGCRRYSPRFSCRSPSGRGRCSILFGPATGRFRGGSRWRC